MKKKTKKITTIEDLAVLMQQEFLAIRDRFDGVDARFDGVDKRLDGVDARFDGVDRKFVELRNELRAEINEVRTELKEEINGVRVIAKRIDARTQNQVDSVYDDATPMKTEMKAMKQDIMALKKHVGMAA